MKFTASAKELKDALNKVANATQTKATIPVLAHILFEITNNFLTLKSSKLDIFVSTEIPAESSDQFSFCAPKLIVDIINRLQDTNYLDIELFGDQIKISDSISEFTLPILSADSFPIFPKINSSSIHLNFNFEFLKFLKDYLLFACSDDNYYHPAKTGVHLKYDGEFIKLSSTDGYRLVHIKSLPNTFNLDATEPFEIIIPRQTIELATKIFKDEIISLYVENNKILFINDQTFENTIQLYSNLIDEKYPNVESIIPLNPVATLYFIRDKLLNSFKQIKLIQDKNLTRTHCFFDNSTLYLESEGLEGKAKIKVDGEFEGEPFEFYISSEYMIDSLSHFPGDFVKINLFSPTKAILLEPNQKLNYDIIHLIMPMKPSD
jgi:DNA polymerase-3 subunit beta